jgi:hypothetical protein
MKRWFFRLITIFFSCVVSLFIAEGLISLVAPQSLILLRPDIWIPVEHLGWRHNPSVDTRVNTGEREIRWRTDEQGFRIGASLPAVSEKTLVAIGDSFLAAMQVEYEETMTAQLEKRLSSRMGRSLRILNTGVGSWGPNQYRIQLGKILANRPVDGVVVFVYLGNDIVDRRIDNYAPGLPEKRHSLRLPKSLKRDELVDAVFYPINDFLEVRSHLFIFAKNSLKSVLMRVGLTAYEWPEALLKSQASSNRWNTTADILEEVADIGKHHDAQTLFVLIPELTEANPVEGRAYAKTIGIDLEAIDFDQPHTVLGAELRKRNLSVVDMTPALRAAIAEQMPDVYGRVDIHLGRAGHQLIARTIEDTIWQMFFSRIAGPPSQPQADVQ